jgi:hypothetical protein
LVWAGLPAEDVEELADAAEGEEGEEDADGVARAGKGAIAAREFEEKQKKQAGPSDGEDEEEAVFKGERELRAEALDEVRRNDDGDEQAQPVVEASALDGDEDDEDEEAEEEDVGELGEDDAGEGKGDVHAYVRAAAEEVAVVDDEDERGEADGLAKLFGEFERSHEGASDKLRITSQK